MSQAGRYTPGTGAPPVETLTGNTGGPVGPSASGNITIIGSTTTGVSVAGNAGTNTLTISNADATETQKGVVELATNAEVLAGTASTNLAIIPSSLTAKLGIQTANGIAFGQGSSSALGWTAAGTNGQLIIAATGSAPAFASLTSTGGTIAITGGANTLNIETSGSVASSFATDSGTATPAGGVITIAGGSNIGTTGAGSTVTVNLDNTVSITGSMTVGNGFVATNGGANITGTTTISGATTINNGIANIGTDAVANAINIGTGAAAKTITIGNTTGATALILNSGTGDITATSSDAITLNAIGSSVVVQTNTLNRLTVDNAGAVTIAVPTAGNTALRINNASGANGLIVTAASSDCAALMEAPINQSTILRLNRGNSTGETSIFFQVGGADVAKFSHIGGDFRVTADSGGVLFFTGGSPRLAISSAGVTSLDTGTGSISLGTDAAAKTITVGNVTGATAVNINTGTGGSAISTTNGAFAVTTGTGAINIGTDAVAKTITVGNATGATSVAINCGTGGISLGTSANAHATTVGSTTALATTTIQGPSAGVFAVGVAGVTPANKNMVTINTATGQLGSEAVPSTTFAWTEVTGTTVAMAVNNGYILNNIALVTATLPATAAIGDIIRVTGKGAGGWRIAQNAGQTIYFGTSTTTTGVGGRLDSTATRDTVDLVCVTANNDFNVLGSIGNITIT